MQTWDRNCSISCDPCYCDHVLALITLYHSFNVSSRCVTNEICSIPLITDIHATQYIILIISFVSSTHIVCQLIPDNKVHGANMGPTWFLSAPRGPHVGPMNLAIRDTMDAPFLVAIGNHSSQLAVQSPHWDWGHYERVALWFRDSTQAFRTKGGRHA